MSQLCKPATELKTIKTPLPPEVSRGRPLRLTVCLLFGIVIGQAISYLPALSGEFRSTRWTGRDDLEMYIALGHSLAHGRGYTRSFDPEHYVAHVHWPPGFPLLLAGTFCLTDSLWAAHALVMFFAVANTLLFWSIAHRYLGEFLGLFAVCLMVCSPLYDQLATHIMAEQPTTFFLLLALWSLGHWAQNGYCWDRWAILAACAIGYGLLVRGLVLPVVAGFGFYALLCPRELPPGRLIRMSRTCLILTIGMTPWFAWTIRGMIVKAPGYDGFTELQTFLRGEHMSNPILPPSAFLGFAWTNLKWFVSDRTLDAFGGAGLVLSEYLHVQLPAWVRITVLGLLALVFLLALRSFRRDGFITLALAMGLLLLLPRPFGGAPRYWLNLQPLFLLVLLGAYRKVWQGLHIRFDWKRWEYLPRAGGIALAGLSLAMLVTDHLHREPQDSKVWNAYVTICQQARALLPQESVVVCHNEIATRWITHRFSVPTQRDFDGPDGRPLYVIYPLPEAFTEIDPTIGFNRMVPPLNRFAGRLSEVTRNDYYVLYRVLGESK